jgi:hypothetical protein
MALELGAQALPGLQQHLPQEAVLAAEHLQVVLPV